MNDFLNGIDGIMSQGFGFIAKIPMRDPNLTPEAKAIYAYICSFAGAGGTAFPGIELMLKELKMSKDRFYKHRKLLEAHGYIEIISEKNEENKFTRNIYKIVTMPVFNQEKFDDYTSRIEKEKQRNNQPYPENQETDLPRPENQDTGNQDTENQETIKNSFNNNSINNNSINNNSINILSKKERKEDQEVKEDKKKTMTLKDKNHSQNKNKLKNSLQNSTLDYSTSKNKSQESHEEIIRKFTKDEELIDLLKEYLVMRYVHNNKKALTNRQLKLLLTELLKLSTKEDEQKAIVSNAIIGGYKRFYGLDDKVQGNPTKNANGSEIKPYDLTQRQLEYVKELYEKQERDQGKKVSNSALFYNWLEE